MTTWNPVTRPGPASWSNPRIGGAYLMTRAGEYVLTRAGEKIIIRVPGGDLNLSTWTGRTIPS